MRKLILIIGACLALVVAGCGSDDSTTSSSSGEEASSSKEAEAPEKKTRPKVKVPNGPPPKKLVIKDLEEGTGPEAKTGDMVQVQYVGVNYKTGEEFDASWNRGERFPFTIGAREVIPGWDQGVAGMKVGGRRELIIPPQLAYGSAGAPGAIPPNETLVFVIDLETVK